MSEPRVRANGEGSVFPLVLQDGRKVWRATASVGSYTDKRGRSQAVKVSGAGGTKTEALRRRDRNLNKWKASVGLIPPEAVETTPTQERLTTAQLLDRWVEWKTTTVERDHKVGPNVARMYRRTTELHIKPHIGSKPARLIKRQDLEDLLTVTLPAKTKADGSRLLGTSPLRQVRNILTMAFEWAVRREYIVRAPTDSLPNFDKARKHDEGLEKKRWIVRETIKHIEGTDAEAVWILAFMGFRQSERLGITWDCFTNLDGRNKSRPTTLEIRQQLWRHPDTGLLSVKPGTKTQAGTRIIPLSNRTATLFRELKARQDRLRATSDWQPLPGMDNLVYTEDNGRPVRHQTDNKRWKALLVAVADSKRHKADETAEEAEARRAPYMLRGHALRHIAISILISQGTPIETVRFIAGHADNEITRAVYNHQSFKIAEEPLIALERDLYSKVKRMA
jgi:integrase